MRPDVHPGVQDSNNSSNRDVGYTSDAIAERIILRRYQSPVILSI